MVTDGRRKSRIKESNLHELSLSILLHRETPTAL
jgi:hypothetical protein